jgi:hypothetical protein
MPSPRKKPAKKSAPKKILSRISKNVNTNKAAKKLTGKSNAKKSVGKTASSKKSASTKSAAKKTIRKTTSTKPIPSKALSNEGTTGSSTRASAVRAFYIDALNDYVMERYEAYKNGEEFDRDFIFDENETRSLTLANAPDAATEALEFYKSAIESKDIGSAKLLAASVDGKPTYAVYTTTDGDDGWLELYDEDGTLLGAARTYLELVAFGNLDDIRAMTETGDYPIDLSDRMTKTLWGK